MAFEVPVAIYLDTEVDVELLEELDIEYDYEDDYVVLKMQIDEVLLESLKPDELLEFIGIDSEFFVYMDIQE